MNADQRVWRVWGRLRNLLQREGADSKVVEIFYRTVVQAVLLFGSCFWFLLTAMEIMAEGTHSRFLRQIVVKRSWQRADGTWFTPELEEVWEAAGNEL